MQQILMGYRRVPVTVLSVWATLVHETDRVPRPRRAKATPAPSPSMKSAPVIRISIFLQTFLKRKQGCEHPFVFPSHAVQTKSTIHVFPDCNFKIGQEMNQRKSLAFPVTKLASLVSA